jgi:hypothetical protein
VSYYAERTPELPVTLEFVNNELRNARPDPTLGSYALSQMFTDYRSAQAFESRGEAMAADLADGLTPEQVRAYRQRALELAKLPNLMEELTMRMKRIYGSLLPGYAPEHQPAKDGVYAVLGPEKQLGAYEKYIKTKLWRIYPRDFWRLAP